MKTSPPQNPFKAAEYSKLTGFDGKWRETWWRNDFLELILKRCKLNSANNLLDIGCGVGHWGRTLSKVLPASCKISGIDIEPAFVERASALAAAYGLKDFNYQVGSAESVPYPSDSFDIVTCQTVLIHVNDPSLALAEMRRVLRPGGVLLLAEPNNIVGQLSFLLAEPRCEWPDVMKLLDFYHICLQGKKNLGMGDSSVGERLPALIGELGFSDIQVAINENCPALIPPYTSENQQIEVEFLKSCIGSGVWWGFGPKSNALRYYEASGKNESNFESLWDLVMAFQTRITENLKNRSYSGGRGPMMYVISAKK